MKILHYTLGLSPYRSGGLTKYSIDLMEEQTKNNQIFLLFPGKFSLMKNIKINRYKNYKNINVYEVVNPLPVPLLGGIENIDNYTKREVKAYKAFYEFFNKIKPDIIHIHTLMGLHYEFIMAAKEKNIKLIYTTHDYFGLCSKVNLIDYKGIVCNDFANGEKCIRCNENSYNLKLIYLMQSSIYRSLKDNTVVKKLRKYKKQKINSEYRCDEKSNRCVIGHKNDYIKLREFYMKYFLAFDYIHFNSNISKNIFNRYGISNGNVLSITHRDIVDKRSKKAFDIEGNLKILYLGPCEKYKGFNFLIDSLRDIADSRWSLSVYGNSFEVDCGDINSKVNFYGRYNYKDLEDIFSKNDVLVIPSVWYETFGFTLLEGMSYGMPVITTEYVGAKDIIKNNYNGFIVKADEKELTNLLEKIISERCILEKINESILETTMEFSLGEHNVRVMNVYNRILGDDR